MIGQTSLLEKFNDIRKISGSNIILGPEGYGKNTLVNDIASNLDIHIFRIDNALSNELKEQIYNYADVCFIVFDIDSKLQTKQIINIQNSILKLLEEPPKTAKIFILAENNSYLLGTILNRCHIIYMESYSTEELRAIARENNITNIDSYPDDKFKYISSPAEVLNLPTVEQLDNVEKLIDTVFNSINRANISNTLSISKKINFKDDNELCDLDTFLRVFEIKLLNLIKNEYDAKYLEAFKVLNKLSSDIKGFNVNKVNLFENFLLDLKNILQ